MRRTMITALTLSVLALPATAQFPAGTLPPSGDNQHSSVVQWIGPVRVAIDYNSPDVHGPDGADRTGKIWGQLVPWGMSNLGFGTCGDQCPWRGGSNENTTLTLSHDATLQGQRLAAGTYGLHFIPGAEEWTIILSKNSTSWGSFTYDAKEDALRVTAKPTKAEYREWLTYEFTDRRPDRATVELRWENLALPWTIAVPDVNEIYVANLRRALRDFPGFTWQAWDTAANFCLQNKINLVEGLAWARHGANSAVFPGQENFTTLSTVAALEEANGLGAEAAKTLERALAHPTAGPVDLHQAGRQMLAAKKKDTGIRVLKMNAQRFPGVWPSPVSLARALAAEGKTKEAIAQMKKALGSAPDEPSRVNLNNLISRLEKGEAID